MFAFYWGMQGLWVLVTLLPLLLLASADKAEPRTTLLDLAGRGLWAVGMAMEVVADLQKIAFSADPANHGRFISTGLWARSRHPNYAGEMLIWAGVWLASLSGLGGWLEGALAALSPLFVAGLLRYVSGVPILERRADKKWGEEPAYKAYKQVRLGSARCARSPTLPILVFTPSVQRTPLLFPRLW
jgi:steroid 5-alpha reductase family enzyme